MAVFGLVAFAGCEPEGKPGAGAEGGKEAPEGWNLQFSDEFEREELGDNWTAFSGKWAIKDGKLTVVESGWEGSEVMCTKKFEGCNRLEYDCMSENPCDLTAIINAGGYGYESGYFVGFGSNYNSRSKLLVQGWEMKEWDAKIEPGKWHHVVAQRDGNVVSQTIDGETVMTYEDEQPLKGEYHQKIGFYIFTEGYIDNVKVYTKPE